jgi:uncharacterized membrane protein (DUF2068 family)
MDNHRIVLGALFIGLGLMGVIGMAVVTVIFFLGSAAISAAAAQEPDVPAFLAVLPAAFGLFITLSIAVGTIPSLVAGYGLLRNRPWSRVWALVAGIVNLPNMPFGTGVGIYAIWVFLQYSRTATGSVDA